MVHAKEGKVNILISNLTLLMKSGNSKNKLGLLLVTCYLLIYMFVSSIIEFIHFHFFKRNNNKKKYPSTCDHISIDIAMMILVMLFYYLV